jgi:hypothetical protein
MIKKIVIGFSVLSAFISCKDNKSTNTTNFNPPTVSDQGRKITFNETSQLGFFECTTVESNQLTAELVAPAKVAATIIASGEDSQQDLVLFDNPELAGNYTQLTQHQITVRQIVDVNMRQRQLEYDRVKDLQSHGAATGKDLLEAQTALAMERTNLANEKAALIEHETRLKAGGFNPVKLRDAKPGICYVICELPENQVSRIKEGTRCHLQFTSFPNDSFSGIIEAVADLVDNTNRMIKVRIRMDNPGDRFKAGMFATVSFGLNEGNYISIPKTALVTIQGNHYAFVKTDERSFERRSLKLGQQIGERLIVYSGLKINEKLAIKGVMQLKGLSFGY